MGTRVRGPPREERVERAAQAEDVGVERPGRVREAGSGRGAGGRKRAAVKPTSRPHPPATTTANGRSDRRRDPCAGTSTERARRRATLLRAAVHGPAGPDGVAQAARLVAPGPATGTLLEVGEEMGGVDELELVVVVRLDEEAGRPAIHRLGR